MSNGISGGICGWSVIVFLPQFVVLRFGLDQLGQGVVIPFKQFDRGHLPPLRIASIAKLRRLRFFFLRDLPALLYAIAAA
jgi:hypothetical protein